MKKVKLISGIILGVILILSGGNLNASVTAKSDTLNYKSYQGKIKSAQTNDDLAYASVILEGTNIATVTNIDGEFIIKVNNNLTAENLLISHIGYKNKTIPLSSFSDKKHTNIKMDPVTEFIKELTVRPANGVEIISQVLKNINKNYSTKPVKMTGFYRETIKSKKRYVGISEAIVGIYKSAYNNDLQFDQVKIDRGRKSTNVEKMDTILVKLQGGPAVSMLLDVVKNPYSILTQDYDKVYDFKLENIVSINDRLHYVFSFVQKEHIDEPYFYGKLYIEIDRLAISEAEFSLNLDNKEEASRVFIRRKPAGVSITPVKTNYRASYTIKDNTWFFNYARAEVKFKLNWKKKLFNSNYSLMSELAITDRVTNNVEKFDRKDRFHRNDIMEEKVYAFFEPEFWGDYNLIEPDASIESAIKKLYRHKK